MKRTRAIASAAASVAVAAVIAGCSNATDTSQAPSPAPPSAGAPSQQAPTQAPHNQADITFAQGMVPHHQQAIEMSRTALERAQSDQVKNLARQIEAAQGPEIETLNGWLRAWGAATSPMPGMDHGGMNHGSMNMGEGMMSPEEMQQFQQATGPEFDRQFLTMMIKHHQGAVTMAQTELTNGQNAEAKQLAQQIISTQNAEIDTMKKLLEQK
ncbi:DUF305 domain-containing protein [Saccharopolyspora sp. SCSIO 74807]|uniref:DUF305 domain-containing protein n=1 Tax=Saccharopolyspora sp. SCSIO 74807 TaxID=3118084 RepID=UPI0030D3EC93